MPEVQAQFRVEPATEPGQPPVFELEPEPQPEPQPEPEQTPEPVPVAEPELEAGAPVRFNFLDGQADMAADSGREQHMARSRARSLPPRVAEAAPAPIRPMRWGMPLFLLALGIALGVATLFFVELYVGRSDEWSAFDAMQAPPPEPVEEAPLPDLELLPSEKWEQEGSLIFFDESPADTPAPDAPDAPVTPEPELPAAAPVEEPLTTGAAMPVENPVLLEEAADTVDDVAPPVEAPPDVVADLEQESSQLLGMLSEEVAGASYSVSFDFDSIILSDGARATLNQVVDRMREQPAIVATITGFADYQGDETYNLVLSRQRANAVRDFLMQAGVAAPRLDTDGRGESSQPDSGAPGEQFRVVTIDLADAG